MSIEAVSWVIHLAPFYGNEYTDKNGKVKRHRMGNLDRTVLFVMADAARSSDASVWLSAGTIAGRLDRRESHVRGSLRALREGGWLSYGDQEITANYRYPSTVYRVSLAFIRNAEGYPATRPTTGPVPLRDPSHNGQEGSHSRPQGVPYTCADPSHNGTQTVTKPPSNQEETDGARGTGGTDLTEHTSWRDRRARLRTVDEPDDRSRATARRKDGKDEDETTGTGTAPTSRADGDQDHEQTTTPDGGHVAPGDATEFSPESGRSAESPSEPSDTPDPHTDTVKPGKGPRAVNPRQREATSRMASGHDNEQRKLAGAERARVIAADYHATGDPMATVAARHGVGVGTVHRAVSKFPAPADLPEVSA